MYAKEYFANTKFTPDPGLCFVFMPFAEQFNAMQETNHDYNDAWEDIAETPFTYC